LNFALEEFFNSQFRSLNSLKFTCIFKLMLVFILICMQERCIESNEMDEVMDYPTI
jgi:hypothetical protein